MIYWMIALVAVWALIALWIYRNWTGPQKTYCRVCGSTEIYINEGVVHHHAAVADVVHLVVFDRVETCLDCGAEFGIDGPQSLDRIERLK